MFKWEEQGCIYSHKSLFGWDHSHAMVPIPYILNKKVLRIFCTHRDVNGNGWPSFIDLNIQTFDIINRAKKPLFNVGKSNEFDSNGIVLTSIFEENNLLHLLYAGFKKINNEYTMLTGSVSSNKKANKFSKNSNNPILDSINSEDKFRTACYVYKIGHKYHYFYSAGSEWTSDFKKNKKPLYRLNQITSNSFGESINEKGKNILKLNEDEHGHGSPKIIKIKNLYYLFYSIRKKNGQYISGLATSKDFKKWTRNDEQYNLSKKSFWVAPIKINDDIYIFYNKNNFGEDGIYLAKLIDYEITN